MAPARIFLLAGLVKSLRQKGVPVDLSSTRVVMAGGALMTADQQRACMEVLGVPIVQLYGSTELLMMITDSMPPLPGSIGKVVDPRIRVRVRNVANSLLPHIFRSVMPNLT